MRGPFRSWKFRRLLAGRVVTNFGDSLYFVAAMWLVYDLTGSSLYSGIAGFLTLLPSVFQFLTGPLVDRWSIRLTLTGTQVFQAVVVLAIPAAHYTGVLTVWLVLLVMPALSILNQFVYPAQSTALPRLLEEEDLVAANSAFSVAYQGVDMVANGIAGVIIGLVGAIAIFLIDAVTFGISALLFATVAVPAAGDPRETGEPAPAGDEGDAAVSDGGAADDRKVADATEGTAGTAAVEASDEVDEPYRDRLRTGMQFLRGTFLMWLVLGVAAVNVTAGMTLAALPAYAATMSIPPALDVLGNAGAYGILMAAFAAGNFLGAIGANLAKGRRLGRTMIVGFVISGLLWTTAIVTDWLPITAVLFALAFVPVGVVNVQVATLIQSVPPEELVGRISSVLGSASAAAIPVGSLVGGAIAETVGARTTILGVGFGVFALAVYVLLIPGLRTLPRLEMVEIGGG